MHYEKFADGSVKCIEDEIPFEIPEGWAWARLSSISQDLPYGTSKKSQSAGKVTVLRMGNLQQAEIDYTDLVYSSDSDDIEKYWLIKGDLLFNRTNSSEWVGKTAIYRGEKPAIFAGYLVRIRSFLEPDYLNVVMNSWYIKNVCLFVKTDAVNQSNIHASKLGKFIIPIPPLREQGRIANEARKLLAISNIIDANKTDLQEIVQQVKSRILDLAIRGKLVPQDPNDEPASVLLERIRAEKEELIKQGKIKRDKKESVIFRGEDNSYYEKIGDMVTCIDAELPFETPEIWGCTRFSSLWQLLSGRDLQPSEYNDEHNGIPYITGASNFSNGEIQIFRWTTSPQVITEAGDLLITCKGTVGEISTNALGKAHIARQIMAIRNIYGLNDEFLRLVLSFYIEKIKRVAKGLIPGISREDILGLLLPVPPKEYQHRVVKVFEEYMTALSDLEESLN